MIPTRAAGKAADPSQLLAKEYYYDYLFGDGQARKPHLHMSLDLTYRCNNKCVQCFLYGTHLDGQNPIRLQMRQRDELTIDGWKKVLDDLWNVGVRALVMTGGEVFLKEGFLDLLEYARVTKGFNISILSNGSMIDEANAERLVAIGPNHLRFSLDGDEATHDLICRTPFFGRLMRGIDLIVACKQRHARKAPKLGFETVIQNVNQGNFSRVVEIAHETGIDDLLFSNVFFTPANLRETSPAAGDDRAVGQRTRNLDAAVYDVDVDVVWNELQRARALADQWKIRLDCRFETRDDVQRIYKDPEFSFVNKCFYPWLMARINPYGDVIPCCGSSLPMGSVRESSFLEIWNGEPYIELRRRLKEANLFPECRKCNTLSAQRWRIWNDLPNLF